MKCVLASTKYLPGQPSAFLSEMAVEINGEVIRAASIHRDHGVSVTRVHSRITERVEARLRTMTVAEQKHWKELLDL